MPEGVLLPAAGGSGGQRQKGRDGNGRIRRGLAGQQAARIRMQGAGKNLLRTAQLHQPALPQHAHPPADFAHQTQVVRDEQAALPCRRQLRKQRGIRQEDLAQALGVSRQTVISLEKGKYNPSLALAFKLARYFGLSIEDIFDDSDEYADEK